MCDHVMMNSQKGGSSPFGCSLSGFTAVDPVPPTAASSRAPTYFDCLGCADTKQAREKPFNRKTSCLGP